MNSMQASRVVLLCFFILAGVGFGLIFSFFLVHCIHDDTVSSLVTITPEQYVGDVTYLEGASVVVTLKLDNRTNENVVVRKIDTSCGCTSLLADGKKIQTPFDIFGLQSILLEATIDTTGITGKQIVLVVVQFDANGKQNVVASEIEIHVRPALRCLTTLGIIADEGDSEEIAKNLFIGDAFPYPGIEIESVTSSLPEIIFCEFRKIENLPEYDFNDNLLPCSKKYLMRRYEISFSFSRNNYPFSGHITVVPKNKEQNILTVPIQYEGSRSKPLLFPPEVFITPTIFNNKSIEVRLVDRRETPTEEIYLKTVPDWLEVELLEKKREYFLISFSILYVPTARDRTSIIFVDSNGVPVAVLPIRFLGTF